MAVTADMEDENRGPKIIGVLWALTSLTTLVVLARMYIRIRMLKNFGSDDWLIALSMCMGLAYCGITTANVVVGYGRHAVFLTESALEMAILLNTVSFLFGILSFALPKLAVSAMLCRILNPSMANRIGLWALTSFAAVVSVICIIILFTMCDPPKALWLVQLQQQGAKCRDTWILVDYAMFTGALSAFVDLYLAIYPSTVLLHLHMSLRKRLALCAALGLGAIASAMAIVKCTQLKGLADKSDYTYGTADLVMWTNIESNVVIIASCIPTLQPILELLLGRRSLSSYSNNSSGKYRSNRYMQASSQNRSHRSASRKPDLAITNVESQESILREDANNHNGHALGQIRRTDNVTVEYEARASEPDRRPSW